MAKAGISKNCFRLQGMHFNGLSYSSEYGKMDSVRNHHDEAMRLKERTEMRNGSCISQRAERPGRHMDIRRAACIGYKACSSRL